MISRRGLIAIWTGIILVGLVGCGSSGNSTSGNVKNDYLQMENSDSGSGQESGGKDSEGQADGGKETGDVGGTGESQVVIEKKYPVSAIYTTSNGAHQKWVYDAQGRVVKKYAAYVSEEEYDRCVISTYDDNGNLISTYYDYPGDDTDSEYVYTYDEKNRLIKEEHYSHYCDKEGNVYDTKLGSEGYTHTYISDTEVLHANNRNEYDKWTEYLDDHGNPLNQKESYYKYSYVYDDRGNMTEYITLYDDGTRRREVFEYNEKNLLVKSYVDVPQAAGSWWAYRYENDLLTEKLVVSSDGAESIREAYTYDEYGNMLTHLVYDTDGKTVKKEEKWVYTYE